MKQNSDSQTIEISRHSDKERKNSNGSVHNQYELQTGYTDRFVNGVLRQGRIWTNFARNRVVGSWQVSSNGTLAVNFTQSF